MKMTENNINNVPDKFVYELWVEFLDTGEKRQRSNKVFLAKAPATALKNKYEGYHKSEINKNFRYFVVESKLVWNRVFD